MAPSVSWCTTTCVTKKVLAWDFCVNFARDNNLQVMPGRSVRRVAPPGA